MVICRFGLVCMFIASDHTRLFALITSLSPLNVFLYLESIIVSALWKYTYST